MNGFLSWWTASSCTSDSPAPRCVGSLVVLALGLFHRGIAGCPARSGHSVDSPRPPLPIRRPGSSDAEAHVTLVLVTLAALVIDPLHPLSCAPTGRPAEISASFATHAASGSSGRHVGALVCGAAGQPAALLSLTPTRARSDVEFVSPCTFDRLSAATGTLSKVPHRKVANALLDAFEASCTLAHPAGGNIPGRGGVHYRRYQHGASW